VTLDSYTVDAWPREDERPIRPDTNHAVVDTVQQAYPTIEAVGEKLDRYVDGSVRRWRNIGRENSAGRVQFRLNDTTFPVAPKHLAFGQLDGDSGDLVDAEGGQWEAESGRWQETQVHAWPEVWVVRHLRVSVRGAYRESRENVRSWDDALAHSSANPG
jgi:hypothetical protein